MTFEGKFKALEKKFCAQVEKDKGHYEKELLNQIKKYKSESSFLPNIVPEGTVDFVLIAREPSTGCQGETKKNFCCSVEDFIIHFAAQKYLCEDDQIYHITDLSKGAMPVKEANKKAQERYERWYPLLKEELQLVEKHGKTRVIVFGNDVHDFLKPKSLCNDLGKVIHYSRQAQSHRNNAIDPFVDRFSEFKRTIDMNAFEETVIDVLNQAKEDCQRIELMLKERVNRSKLKEPQLKSLFYYKIMFERLRSDDNIILKKPSEWR